MINKVVIKDIRIYDIQDAVQVLDILIQDGDELYIDRTLRYPYPARLIEIKIV